MLSTEEFKTFSNEYVMFAHVTTRIEGRKHDDLLGQKGGRGFPHLVALNGDGDVISKLEGGRTVEGFRTMMAAGAKFEEIRAKADKTVADEVFLLGHDIAMGNADLESARQRRDALEGLTDEQKAELDGAILGLEIADALPKRRGDTEGAKAAGRQFAEWFAAGREPSSDQYFQPFFILMLDHAESSKDAALFEKALEKLRGKYGDNPRAAGFFKKQDERLEALKAPPVEDHDETGDDGM